MIKHRCQSNLGFLGMSWIFRLRDWLRPPVGILQEEEINPGMTIMDFGCGPGSFSLAAAQLVGNDGLVYAVDIHPRAIRAVQKAAEKKRLKNIRTVCGSPEAVVPTGRLDVVILYDVIHAIPKPGLVLMELNRFLKPKGILSVSDHHLKEADLLSMITEQRLFRYIRKNRWTYRFEKAQNTEVLA